MKQDIVFRHEFVECLPEVLKERTLYVCMDFATVSHKCPCGCGKEVVTPLSPTDWKLIYDGRTVTLHPSIGNWGFECRSHYWIRGNRVEWAPSWSDKEIKSGRAHDRFMKDKYFESASDTPEKALPAAPEPGGVPAPIAEFGVWQRVVKWWRS